LKKQMLLSVLLVAIFAIGIVSMAVPVKAAISGECTIVLPNYVVPGGSIWVYVEGYSATGGSTYFFLSEDNDAEISSGDIEIAKMDTSDVEDAMADLEGVMVKIPTDVDPDEYYVKVSEDNDVGDDALPSDTYDNLKAEMGLPTRGAAGGGVPSGWDGLDTIEVLEEEDWPTITLDPESGTVWKPYPDEEYREIDVEGEDIDEDYEDTNRTELFWGVYNWTNTAVDDYEGLMEDADGRTAFDVADGEFDAEDVVLTEAFMGEHDILVLLWNSADAEFLGTYGTFTVESSIDVYPDETFSIEADELEEWVEIRAHGFPEGTVDADEPPEFQVRDIETGDLEETVVAEIAKDIDVEDDDGEPPGTFDDADVGSPRRLNVTDIDEAPEGIIDITIVVNGETLTFEKQLLSSVDSDPGDAMGLMTPTSGEIGDDVWFYAIDLPAATHVNVTFADGVRCRISEMPGVDLADLVADGNGAWKIRVELSDLPGGEFDVELEDIDYNRGYDLGVFEVLPTIEFYERPGYPAGDDITSTTVGDGDDDTYAGTIEVYATGFLVDAVFTSIEFAGEPVDEDEYWAYAPDDFEVEIDETGIFESGLIEVPHISGGGKEVTVEIIGEDADGDRLVYESEITVDPRIQNITVTMEDDEYETLEGVLVLEPLDNLYPIQDDYQYWVGYLDTDYIFGGNPMMITGVGFLAGESVTVTFTSEDKDIEEACTILKGGKADSDGDLEVIFMLPHTRDFAKTIADGDIEVAGATDTNKDSVYDRYSDEDYYDYTEPYIEIDPADDTYAKLFFNIDFDPDLDLTVYVGDEVKLTGCGFDTKDLVFEILGDEVGEATATYGYFETTITIPELERSDPDLGGVDPYRVDETETGQYSADFDVESKVVLSVTEAVAGAEVTAYGTGWVDDLTVDIVWPDLPALVADIEPDTGSWEETFKVPDVEPGPYTILVFDEELEDAEEEVEVTFKVLGPLSIASLTMPGTVYPESTITISVNVQNYFGTAVSGAKVTGKITPPVGAAITLTFPATDAAGISSASWKVPADAAEGTYKVDVTASKPEAGADATATGTFYVEPKVVPPPPVDISALEKSVSDLSKSVTGLSGDLSKLATDVSGLKSDIAALEAAIAAIPVVPVEWIYITAIMAIIAAIAAIAAVVAVYRKIA